MESRASLTFKPSARRCAGLAPRRAASQACRAPRSARPTRCQATQASGGKVSFRLQQQVPFKTYFKVCGNVEELGAWDLEKAPMMEWSEGDVWSVDVTIPAGVDLEYKVVKVPRREPIAWESGPNRSLKVPDSELILKMAFDIADATEVVGVEVPSEEEVIVAEPPSVDDPLKPVEEIVAEQVTESVAAKKEVLEEVAEQIADEMKEEAAQGVDMEKIVEGVTESAADAKDAVSKKATASSKGSKTTGKSSPSGATVAAASVVEEEKNKKNIFGGLFGGFGKK